MYVKPELLLVGSASALVLGGPPGDIDNGVVDFDPKAGLALGLDD
jgi:hypothetical protein